MINIKSDWYRYMHSKKLSWAQSSVHYENTTRMDEAKVQLNKTPKTVEKVIELTNKFLQNVGLRTVKNPIFTSYSVGVGDYGYKTAIIDVDAFNKQFSLTSNPLNNEKHVVWMKFIKGKNIEGENIQYLGAVAASNDYNFDVPPDDKCYNNKVKNKYGKEVWEYSTSGIILHKLKLEVNNTLEWDDSFILVFPLPGITDGLCKDIEQGIGNYLISEDVPIIDFYSHVF